MSAEDRSNNRRYNQEVAAIDLIAEALNTDLEFGEMQERIIGGICQVLDSEAGSLLLLNEGFGELVLKNTREGKLTWIYQIPLKSNGVVEQAIENRTPLLLNTFPEDSSLNIFQNIPDFKASSMLCAPMSANGHNLGAVAVLNKRHSPFNTHDQDLLMAMAASIAHAIYNTRLIQQLKIANADLEASRWQLLRSRNTLRALFDSIPASIYIVDRRYDLIAVNRNRAQRTQDQPNVLVGKKCYDALYHRNDVCPGCRVIETLFGGENTVRTKREWDTNDIPQEWEISTFPIFDDNAEVLQAILLEQDVTERRQLETTLAQSEKLAAVGQLAAGVAHEINNPLTAVIANAQLLQREIPVEDEKRELVDLIARAGSRAAQVVHNLLDLARKEQYEFEPTDINDTINKALALIQHELISRSILLTFQPSKELPRIKASANHLQGVWLNLLVNAIDAVAENHGQIKITTRQHSNEVRIVVADTGKGIPADKLTRIFEPFYTTKAPGQGTGLGLSVCHRTIKQHGGRILVNSQIGIGTEFTIILPVN